MTVLPAISTAILMMMLTIVQLLLAIKATIYVFRSDMDETGPIFFAALMYTTGLCTVTVAVAVVTSTIVG